MLGPIWVHLHPYLLSLEQAVIGLESQAVSAKVIKHFVTILVKHVRIVDTQNLKKNKINCHPF